MNVGRVIKHLRRLNDLTQEELGHMLVPRVNRQAINKWETGRVENIKRSHIEQMAKIFGVKPSVFFDFEEETETLSEDEKKLIQAYRELSFLQKRDLIWYAQAIKTKNQTSSLEDETSDNEEQHEPLDPYLEILAKQMGILKDDK